MDQRRGPPEKLIERESVRSKCGAGASFAYHMGSTQTDDDFVLLEAGNTEPLESKVTLTKLRLFGHCSRKDGSLEKAINFLGLTDRSKAEKRSPKTKMDWHCDKWLAIEPSKCNCLVQGPRRLASPHTDSHQKSTPIRRYLVSQLVPVPRYDVIEYLCLRHCDLHPYQIWSETMRRGPFDSRMASELSSPSYQCLNLMLATSQIVGIWWILPLQYLSKFHLKIYRAGSWLHY